MKLVNKYVMTVELYSDDSMNNNGYFFNVLTIYYNYNGNPNTNHQTVKISNYLSKKILKELNILPKKTPDNFGLCYYHSTQLEYIEYILSLRHKAVAKTKIPKNLKGKIYIFYYDKYNNMMNDVIFRCIKLKSAIKNNMFSINNIIY